MSLRFKVASVIGVISPCSFFLTFFATNRLLLRDSLKLENEDLAGKVTQLSRIIESERKNLERIVADWAFWDDTYEFLGGEYPEYVDVNCTDDVFPNLGIYFLGFFKEDGTLFYGKSVDPNTQRPFPLPQELVRLVQQVGASLSPGYLLDRRSGFLPVGKEVWFFALSWVLTSDLSGPPQGFLVMARKVDEPFLGHLSDLFGHRVTLEMVDRASFAEKRQKGFVVRETTPFQAIVAVPFPYALGEDGFAFTFPYRRSFLVRGQEVAKVLLWGHVAGSLAIFLFLFLLVEHVAVRRVLRLTSFLKRVREAGDFTARFEAKGNDEVALVGEAVNVLLEEVERKRKELVESEARFRRLFEEVPVGVYQARFGGEILQANPKVLEILGYTELRELQELGLSSFRQDAFLSLATFEQFLKERGEIQNVVSTWRVRDGSLRFLRESARVIGEDVYEGTLEDVTEEVLAREDVRRNEMYYRILLEYSSDGVVVLDREGYALPPLRWRTSPGTLLRRFRGCSPFLFSIPRTCVECNSSS
ncbi:MAG: PAS domain S-box protein [Candidatus Caldatribacterium sp.]|nr:PAS domain S-box protein [Candidatus Caldatribacterium sp.]